MHHVHSLLKTLPCVTCVILLACGGGATGSSPSPNENMDADMETMSGDSPTITQVTVGLQHTCALTTEGSVTCWGAHFSGQLGNGGEFSQNEPTDASGPLQEGVSMISAGHDHTCALKEDKTIWCWGDNSESQFSSGSEDFYRNAREVNFIFPGANLISARKDRTCTLIDDGKVKCWGKLANENEPIPQEVSGLEDTTVVSIATGAAHSCVVTSEKKVKCWGSNTYGQLGNGTQITSPLSDVIGLSDVDMLSLGQAHSCALTSEGAVKCWGASENGRLGSGPHMSDALFEGKPEPVDVAELGTGNTSISAGTTHTCAVTSQGGVKCWGKNDFGQLGDGTLEDKDTPVDVVGLDSGVVSVAAGVNHSCAVMSTGGVKCWGNNSRGQLGNGTRDNSPAPVDVSGLGMQNQ